MKLNHTQLPLELFSQLLAAVMQYKKYDTALSEVV